MTKIGRRRRQRRKLQKEQRALLELLRKHVSECLSKPLIVRGKVGKVGLPTGGPRLYPKIVVDYDLGLSWRPMSCYRCGLRYRTRGASPDQVRIKFFGVMPAWPDAVTLLGLTLKTACSG